MSVENRDFFIPLNAFDDPVKGRGSSVEIVPKRLSWKTIWMLWLTDGKENLIYI